MTEEIPVPELKSNYPANSHKSREPIPIKKEDRPKLERVTSGEAVQRKKPLGRKIADTFTGDDAHSTANFVLFDVVLPAVKAMISDAISQGMERLLFGDSKRRGPLGMGNRGAGTASYTSYNRMSAPNSHPSENRREISSRSRATHEFDEIVLASRGEAESVLDCMMDLISDYKVATVSDLYDLVGISADFTDNKWGWTDLRMATVSNVRAGYLLNLPKTTPID